MHEVPLGSQSPFRVVTTQTPGRDKGMLDEGSNIIYYLSLVWKEACMHHGSLAFYILYMMVYIK